MRRLAQCLAIALLAGAAVVAVPPPPPIEAAGTPPVCSTLLTNNPQQRCNRLLTAGMNGSIGLIGDSVLLGSADGFWGGGTSVGLPTMLANQGFGPISLVATQGMTTKHSQPAQSGSHWIDQWKLAGFVPDIVAINLGANHFGTCTAANPAPCKAKIDELMNKISAQFPNAVVWWAHILGRVYPSGNYSTGMLGWNAALNQAATARPNLMIWDWPTALKTSNPSIAMDLGSVHPTGPAGYTQRSKLMTSHITTTMAPSRLAGPRVTLPPGDGSGYGFSPVAPANFYTTPADGDGLAANETRVIDMTTAPGYDVNAPAVALTVTTSAPSGVGFLTVYRCGDTLPVASNLNYFAGQPRSAQAVVRPNGAEEVCIFSNTATDITVAIQGNFVAAGGYGLTPITPIRRLDTRNTGRAADHVIQVPGTAVEAAAVTVTVTKGSPGGSVSLYECGAPQSTVANVSFNPNETVASAAFVPVSDAGTICAHVNTPTTQWVDVIVDVTGTFHAGSGLRFVPTTNTRTLDTRNGTGGWVNRHRFNQTIHTIVGPVGAKAVTGTITLVKPTHPGAFLTAHPCGALPVTSSVNAGAGQIMANSITVGVEPTQRRLCIYSAKNTSTLFDVAGWWVEAT